MGLEAKIITAVNDVLPGSSCMFECGTLFVGNITEDEPELVVEAIQDFFGRNAVEVMVSGPIWDALGHEYAFDF